MAVGALARRAKWPVRTNWFGLPWAMLCRYVSSPGDLISPSECIRKEPAGCDGTLATAYGCDLRVFISFNA